MPVTRTTIASPWERAAAGYDAGLRSYLLRVYTLVTAGVGLTGLVAALVASVPALRETFFQANPVNHHLALTGAGWVALLAPFALLLAALAVRAAKASTGIMSMIYWAFCSCFGVSVATLLMQYGYGGMALPFVATVASFSGLCLWGYTSKRDLSGIGAFCVMGLFGIILVSFGAMLFGYGLNQTVISVVALAVFVGITAWDSQRIKVDYIQSRDGSWNAAHTDAISLYLDFLNILMQLASLLNGKDD
jgi:FtsH-binding integral membrane protein